MKTKFNCFFTALTLLALSTLNHQLSTVHAQGTAFTYQGRLNNNGNPANGSYDFRFKLYFDPLGNTQAGGSYVTNAIPAANGLFTVAIDFGAGIFTGNNYWLEVDVKTNLAGGYTVLSPLQAVTPTPYAITAENVVGLTVQQNTNGSPNVIEGSSVNYISNSVYGATIAGGGTANLSNSVTADFGTVGGGAGNTASGWASTVGGGAGNIASSPDGSATVGGGYYNTASGDSATAGGGFNNIVNGPYATVGGGDSDTSSSYSATVGGGQLNTASGEFATVGGGFENTASGYIATVGGGAINTASGQHATVGGGYLNTAAGNDSFAAGYYGQATNNGTFVWSDESGDSFSSTANNQFSVRAVGGVRFVTSGAGMTLDGQAVATVAALANVALRSGGNNFTGQQTVTGGSLGIGTTSPQTSLHLFGTDGTQLRLQKSVNNKYWNIYAESYNNSGNLVFTPSGLGTTGGYINQGDGNYYSLSDRRLKQDITPLDGVLDKVLQLRPVSYHFRSAPEGTPPTLGLIAQEVEPLFPEVVGEHAGMKSLAYSELVPVTIGAIQELNQKLEEKNSEIQNLKQQNDLLEKRLSELETTVKSLAEKK